MPTCYQKTSLALLMRWDTACTWHPLHNSASSATSGFSDVKQRHHCPCDIASHALICPFNMQVQHPDGDHGHAILHVLDNCGQQLL